MSHLIVDIKHSLLDLLIDLLGCVDESLRQKVRKTGRGDSMHVCMLTPVNETGSALMKMFFTKKQEMLNRFNESFQMLKNTTTRLWLPNICTKT